MDAPEELKRTRLMVLARGVPKDVLLKAVGAIEETGVTVFESTFDHRRADCVAENAEKIAALVTAYGDRMAIGAGTVLSVEEVRAAHAAGATVLGNRRLGGSLLKRHACRFPIFPDSPRTTDGL